MHSTSSLAFFGAGTEISGELLSRFTGVSVVAGTTVEKLEEKR